MAPRGPTWGLFPPAPSWGPTRGGGGRPAHHPETDRGSALTKFVEPHLAATPHRDDFVASARGWRSQTACARPRRSGSGARGCPVAETLSGECTGQRRHTVCVARFHAVGVTVQLVGRVHAFTGHTRHQWRGGYAMRNICWGPIGGSAVVPPTISNLWDRPCSINSGVKSRSQAARQLSNRTSGLIITNLEVENFSI